MHTTNDACALVTVCICSSKSVEFTPQEDIELEYLFNPLFILVAGVAVCIGLFLALREVALWYFRINQIADNIAVIADYCRAQKAPVP